MILRRQLDGVDQPMRSRQAFIEDFGFRIHFVPDVELPVQTAVIFSHPAINEFDGGEIRGGVRPYALDPDRARALWAKSEEMVEERF